MTFCDLTVGGLTASILTDDILRPHGRWPHGHILTDVFDLTVGGDLTVGILTDVVDLTVGGLAASFDLMVGILTDVCDLTVCVLTDDNPPKES